MRQDHLIFVCFKSQYFIKTKGILYEAGANTYLFEGKLLSASVKWVKRKKGAAEKA
jgi:hypothetical protein